MIGRRYVMGTILTVEVTGGDLQVLEQARAKIFSAVQDLETKLSKFKSCSEVSRINQAAGQHPVQVSPETYRVLELALHFAERTEGAFDPTLQGHYRDVFLNPQDQTVFLSGPNFTLDLGGIGKGFAVDHALKYVQGQSSLESVFINFGGQLTFWHQEGIFPPETVSIENPIELGRILSTFDVTANCTVSTSSQGERQGHLRDPRSGYSAGGMESVTVVASTGTEAEALSTAVFVRGQDGLTFIEKGSATRVFLFPRKVAAA